MEAGGETIERTGPLRGVPTWGLVAGAVALIAAVLIALAVAGGDSLPDRLGPPVEELAVERTELEPGPDRPHRSATPGPTRSGSRRCSSTTPTSTSQGADGSIGRLGSATVELDYPWQEGQPYLISMVTSTGVVIEHEIAAAVETPEADGALFGLMALLGTYVGIVPVVLGMAAAAGDATLPVELGPGADGVHGRPARVPRRRRDARGARPRRRAPRAPSAAPSCSSSAPGSPTWC